MNELSVFLKPKLLEFNHQHSMTFMSMLCTDFIEPRLAKISNRGLLNYHLWIVKIHDIWSVVRLTNIIQSEIEAMKESEIAEYFICSNIKPRLQQFCEEHDITWCIVDCYFNS